MEVPKQIGTPGLAVTLAKLCGHRMTGHDPDTAKYVEEY